MSNQQMIAIEESPIFTSDIVDFVNSEAEIDQLIEEYKI